MSCSDEQQEIIEEFAFFDEWMDRYQYLIDLGKQLPEYPAEYQTDKYLVDGCQSQVWFHTWEEDGKLHFEAISDSAIVSGLCALLMRIYSGREAKDILQSKPEFVTAIGLDRHLSQNRSNGLQAMLNTINEEAQSLLNSAA